MIISPKYKGIEVGKPLEITTGLSGEFQFTLRDENLKAVYVSDWGDNTILDVGLDTIGGGTSSAFNPFTYWHVGNSAAAVLETQTGLQGWIASSTVNQGSDVNVWIGTPNWEYNKTRVHRFAAGAINDTVREVGAGASNTNNINFYSRHLVTPVIPVGIDQVLDVAYRHTIWPMLADVDQAAAVTLEGNLYDVLIRGSEYDRVDVDDAMSTMALSNSGGSNDLAIFNGDIGATILDRPAGPGESSYGGGSDSNLNYVMGTHQRDVLISWGLNNGNGIGDIRCLLSRFTGAMVQIQFDRNPSPSGLAIPKDNTKTMDITLRQSWVRHV